VHTEVVIEPSLGDDAQLQSVVWLAGSRLCQRRVTLPAEVTRVWSALRLPALLAGERMAGAGRRLAAAVRDEAGQRLLAGLVTRSQARGYPEAIGAAQDEFRLDRAQPVFPYCPRSTPASRPGGGLFEGRPASCHSNAGLCICSLHQRSYGAERGGAMEPSSLNLAAFDAYHRARGARTAFRASGSSSRALIRAEPATSSRPPVTCLSPEAILKTVRSVSSKEASFCLMTFVNRDS
jgi:hypothetical protein